MKLNFQLSKLNIFQDNVCRIFQLNNIQNIIDYEFNIYYERSHI